MLLREVNLSRACKQHMPLVCLRLSKALRVGSRANVVPSNAGETSSGKLVLQHWWKSEMFFCDALNTTRKKTLILQKLEIWEDLCVCVFQ